MARLDLFQDVLEGIDLPPQALVSLQHGLSNYSANREHLRFSVIA